MKFYKQKTEIQKAITIFFFKKLLSDTNNFSFVLSVIAVFSKCVVGLH